MRTHRPLGAVLLCTVLLSTALLGACATSQLDTANAETQITAKLRSLYPALQVGATTCPTHVRLGSGRTFTCTVPVSGQIVHVAVRQDDGHGKVSFRTTEYLLEPAAAASYLKTQTVKQLVARNQSGPGDEPVVTVNCGQGPLMLVAQPGSFSCTVTTPDGSYVEVGSVSADGSVHYTVPNPPPNSTPTPAAPATVTN